MDLVLTRGMEGVQNPENLADVICTSSLMQDTLPNSTYESLPLQVPGGHFLLVNEDFRYVFKSAVGAVVYELR